jgi:Mn-dependent DtxR family transcriptional regulator
VPVYRSRPEGQQNFKTGKETKMSEQLLTQTDVTQRLHISKTTFNRMRHRLASLGLQHVILGGMIRYRQASLDRLIADCAEQKKPMA